MTTEEILLTVSICVTAVIGIVGFAFTACQIRKSSQVRQAEYIRSLTEMLRLNSDVRDAFYMIEYNQNWYNESFHNGGDNERKIDALLSEMDYLCYAAEKKMINKTDFSYFQYDLNRISQNDQVQSYMWNLHHWSENFGGSYIYFVNYMLKNLSEDKKQQFYDKNSKEFRRKQLNF